MTTIRVHCFNMVINLAERTNTHLPRGTLSDSIGVVIPGAELVPSKLSWVLMPGPFTDPLEGTIFTRCSLGFPLDPPISGVVLDDHRAILNPCRWNHAFDNVLFISAHKTIRHRLRVGSDARTSSHIQSLMDEWYSLAESRHDFFEELLSSPRWMDVSKLKLGDVETGQQGRQLEVPQTSN